MNAEDTESIFNNREAYFNDSEDTAKDTGLGLILCREFIEYHNGKIWIDKAVKQETRVCFSLPIGKAEVINPEDIQQEQTVLDIQKKSRLIGILHETTSCNHEFSYF